MALNWDLKLFQISHDRSFHNQAFLFWRVRDKAAH